MPGARLMPRRARLAAFVRLQGGTVDAPGPSFDDRKNVISLAHTRDPPVNKLLRTTTQKSPGGFLLQ